MRPDQFYPYFRELTKAVPEGTKSLKIEKKQKNASHESKFSARGGRFCVGENKENCLKMKTINAFCASI